jgi:hypothetical protein
VPETGEYRDNKTGETISPDEFTQKKQAIEDGYEEQVAGLTGNAPQHVTIPVSDAQPKGAPGGKASTGAPASTATNAPAQQTRPLTDKNIARQYLQRAGGDKNKARELARKDGYTF